jgi:hypothetical protein
LHQNRSLCPVECVTSGIVCEALIAGDAESISYLITALRYLRQPLPANVGNGVIA